MLMVAIDQELSAKEMSVERAGEVGPTTRPSGGVRQVQRAKNVKFVSFAVRSGS